MRTVRSTRYAWIVVAIAFSANAVAADSVTLSPAQQQRIASAIAHLKYPQERSLANAWSPAKKVAEFICHSDALRLMQKQDRSIDRIFLGDGKDESLHLVSSHLLEGTGSFRKGNEWKDMSFQCQLDPATGKVLRFNVHAASGHGSN